MADHVYKTIEITGSSPKNLRWFQVIDTRGEIEGAAVAHWQVTMKVGFTLD